MINTLEELLQDYARYSFMEGTIDENTSIHLVEDAQNYIKALGKENLLRLFNVVGRSELLADQKRYCNDCGDYVGKGCDNSDCKDFKS